MFGKFQSKLKYSSYELKHTVDVHLKKIKEYLKDFSNSNKLYD